MVISADHSARVCLRDLGYEMVTPGAFVHGLIHFGSKYLAPKIFLDKMQVEPYRNKKKND